MIDAIWARHLEPWPHAVTRRCPPPRLDAHIAELIASDATWLASPAVVIPGQAGRYRAHVCYGTTGQKAMP
jgi:hypothetical protein